MDEPDTQDWRRVTIEGKIATRTSELRFHEGRLQQLFLMRDYRYGPVANHYDEWRDVPGQEAR